VNTRRKAAIARIADVLEDGDDESQASVASELNDVLEAEELSYKKYMRQRNTFAMEHSAECQHLLTSALEAMEEDDSAEAVALLRKIAGERKTAAKAPATKKHHESDGFDDWFRGPPARKHDSELDHILNNVRPRR